MSTPIQRPPEPRRVAFYTAVARRLGIDPDIVSDSGFNVSVTSGDRLASVSLTAFLPDGEVLALMQKHFGNELPAAP